MRSTLHIATMVALGLLATTNVRAQAIEESYANLCSDPAVSKSETCAALRQALIAKLQAEGGQAAPLPGAIAVHAATPASTAPAAGAVPVAAPVATAGLDTATAALWRKRWGLFLDLIGKRWMVTGSPGYVSSHDWKVPGEEMVSQLTAPDGRVVKLGTHILRWDEASQRIVPTKAKADYYMLAQPDGSVMNLNTKQDEQSVRSVSRLLADGSFEKVFEEKKGGTWVQQSRHVMWERTPERIALERQQEIAAAQAAKEERSKRGSLLGTLLIAGVGAAAANAYGGDATQILGGALKGVQIANADKPQAAALGGLADSMVSGGNAMGAGGAVEGGGIAAGGSYPTRPNLATAACAGFTEGNYRQKALSGGGDQQLYTMCGQAFEYYTMYQRAIAQGYSEADANRTYAAHEQSASVASGYLAS